MFQRLLFGLAVLLDPQHHHGIGVQLQGGAVGALGQHLGTEGGLYHLTVGGDAFAAFTTEGSSFAHFQPQLLGRLLQVGGFEGGILEFLGHLDEALLHFLRLQLALQLRLQAVQTRHLGGLDIVQTDQVPAELALHRGGNLAHLQGEQGLLERHVVDALTGIAEIAAGSRRARIVGELLGQRGEVFAGEDALTQFLKLGAGLLVVQRIAGFQQDVRGLALLAEVGDFLLVLGLQLLGGYLDLIEEALLLQLDILDAHLLGGHELAGVLVVVGLELLVGDAHRCAVGL